MKNHLCNFYLSASKLILIALFCFGTHLALARNVSIITADYKVYAPGEFEITRDAVTFTIDGIAYSFKPEELSKVTRKKLWNENGEPAFESVKISEEDKIKEDAKKEVLRNTLKNENFEIIQVMDGGCHAFLFDSVWHKGERVIVNERSGKRIFIRGNHSDYLANGEIYSATLYWAGTYRYITTEDKVNTVQSYCAEMNDAIEVWAARLNGTYSDGDLRISPNPGDRAYGTAFAITDKGHLITNWHVVEDAKTIKVIINEKEHVAKVVGSDKVNDLALLKIDASTTPLFLGFTTAVDIGDKVLALGYPNPDIQGKSVKLTDGVVSSLKGLQDDPVRYQISAPIQPGNSGGPLVAQDNSVIGIIDSKIDDFYALKHSGSISQNVNYAIKVDYLRPLLKLHPDVIERIADVRRKEKISNISEFAQASIHIVKVEL